MDNICELKLSIFSGIHRIIDRALHLEQAIDGLHRGPFAGCSPVEGGDHPQRAPSSVISLLRASDDSTSDTELRIRQSL